jgi:hypothetical protein
MNKFYPLLMWLWPVHDINQRVSGMPSPQFGNESSWIRGSELVQRASGCVRSFHVFPKMSSSIPGVRVPHVKDHCTRQIKYSDINKSNQCLKNRNVHTTTRTRTAAKPLEKTVYEITHKDQHSQTIECMSQKLIFRLSVILIGHPELTC